MKKSVFFAIIIAFLAISCNNSENSSETLQTDEIAFTKEGELQLIKKDSSVIDLEIEVADTDYETSTGLMYRKKMQEDRGMLFIFSGSRVHSFYMKNTEFPLDIIYIDSDKKIVTIAENAQPFDEMSLSSKVPVQYVLEVNGGMTQKWDVKIGDSIKWKLDQ